MRTQTAMRRIFLVLSLMLLTPMLALAADDDDDDWGDDEKQGPSYELHGFVESTTASRVVNDATTEDHLLLGEARFRLELRHEMALASLSFKGDLVADAVSNEIISDIREAIVSFRLGQHIDVKAGRQVLTWGTGDLLFLNDLFPKDWVSFMTGRADEYLKAPANALMVGIYSKFINVDLVWTPIFTPDRFITGERLSFFNPMANGIVGGQQMVVPVEVERKLQRGEFHGRLHRTVGGYELALYGYYGFSKQPLALENVEGVLGGVQPSHARLGVYGASVRGSLFGGVVNLESAFHHSMDDGRGRNWAIPNHQVRGLLGYEHELVQNMTLSAQYYTEFTLQHDALMENSPNPAVEPDELRHVVTTRWMYRLMRDNLILGLFAFYSPNDRDFFLRPKVEYKVNDALKVAVGGNVFWGDRDHTFFGQLQDNSNVYARARYTF
ncbi:MAG: hypothetical protein JRH20_10940 [Deltaproteobacteria bacterium]|nr:hypothetical protein [Deltaproteobacteria bacterium]